MKIGKKIIALFFAALFIIGMLYTGYDSFEARAATEKKLSNKEKEYYKKIIKSIKGSSYMYTVVIDGKKTEQFSSVYSMLYDLNGDGRKEFLLSGFVGIQGTTITYIVSYDGKKFRTNTVYGELYSVSKKGIIFLNSDKISFGSGDKVYDDYDICTISKKGKLKKRLYSKIVKKYDYSGESIESEEYGSVNGKKTSVLTKKKFDQKMKKLKFSEGIKRMSFSWIDVNNANPDNVIK